ncbi:hypothetical protein ACTOB_004108 [Actinoplanes oblitus]|uniref:Uncharacterized protein n=1 Tax=Actinoplanes oblitus TaxID=3040509 RepID=A0ABY8WRY8_9ACTN|nr:hypothetical protein [Actinoplanes oblitus]WIN00404.1 hypothetical protein ACTOB_004108 [Actinoplanes oblitus]
MTDGDELPEVLPSGPDDEYECVLLDPRAALAPPSTAGTGGETLCPPGYVPRLKRRAPYGLRGKERIAEDPPTQNPEPPPAG